MMATTHAAADEPAFATDDTAEWWALFEEMTPHKVVDEVVSRSDDPGTRRDLLTSWLAFELNFSPFWYPRSQLASLPLWEVLDRGTFESIGRDGERALAVIAASVEGPLHPTLHPKAAVAAVALWRHARSQSTRRKAGELLRQRPLPVDADWLFRLACRLVDLGAARGTEETPGLFQIAARQLGARFWRVAAHLAAMYFVRRYQSFGDVPSLDRMVEACDRAAEVAWRREGNWLELMGEAAVRGHLRAPWLEKPVAACLRCPEGGGASREALQRYHRRRPYEADHERLDTLYGHLLDIVLESDRPTSAWARRRLRDEILAALPGNPVRARRLAELVLLHEYPTRFGSFAERLRHALGSAADETELPAAARLLAGLYVACYEVEPYALQFVDAVEHRVDWDDHPVASRDKLGRYLQISDYDRGFEDVSVSIGGATIALGDKDAAVRVRYFRERRFERSSLVRLSRRILAPLDWLGSTLRQTDPLEEIAVQCIEQLEGWYRHPDERLAMVEAYRDAGLSVESFEDILGLDADVIDDYTERLGNQRLLIGLGAGLAAGAFAPSLPMVVSLLDLPVKILLSVDIASRFPWAFGFDLRDDQTLPRDILAVALEAEPPAAGGDPASTLAELAIQTSLFVRAVGSGDPGPLAGRVARGVIEQFVDGEYGGALGASVESAIRSALAPAEPPGRLQRIAGALTGGVIGGTLVYDVSRSARALLTDRFLARKYSDWKPHL